MNCKRQSHDAKYMCGLPTVKTCYVFAVINAIVVSLGVLGLLGLLGLLFYLTATYGQDWVGSEVIVTALCLAGSYMATAIAAVFAILLLVGIRKKRPKLVKAYLFYGIVVEMLMIGALGTALFFNEMFRGNNIIYLAIVCGSCVTYAFILRLVMDTYIVLSSSHRFHVNRTEVQALFMLGPNGELQVLPLVR